MASTALTELRPGTYTVTFTLPGFTTLKRDGLELRTELHRQIDAELTVGPLQETDHGHGRDAAGRRPDATQQRTISREVLDAVPTAKSMLGIAALIPAVVEPPNAQDVGGSKGERSVRITVHGGKTFDSRLLQDGMRYNALTPGIGGLEGTGRGYYVNPLAVAGNRDRRRHDGLGRVLARWRAGQQHPQGRRQPVQRLGVRRRNRARACRATISTTTSIAQGLTSVNSVQKVYDFNGAFGGPVLAERLWFFAAGAALGDDDQRRQPVCRRQHGSTSSTRRIPDGRSNPKRRQGHRRPADVPGDDAQDKFTFSYDKQRNFQDQLTGQLETGTDQERGNPGYCQRHEVTQGTWTRPQSNNLLFDAGVTVSKFNFGGFGNDLFLSDYEGCGGGIQDNVSINDTGLGFTYNGGGNRTMSLSHQSNGRFNMSFITGRHNIKTGIFWMYGLGGGHRTYTDARADTGQRPAGVVHVQQRRPALADPVRVAQPHRSISSIRTSGSSSRTSGASIASRSAPACGSTGCASR